jgi:hypothetical protein
VSAYIRLKALNKIWVSILIFTGYLFFRR